MSNQNKALWILQFKNNKTQVVSEMQGQSSNKNASIATPVPSIGVGTWLINFLWPTPQSTMYHSFEVALW